jgi:gustatory receptor
VKQLNFTGYDGVAPTFGKDEFLVGDKMDKKLILLCRLHDEICEIGKSINTMFSFQMLLTMAYGFMNTTAQFYFLYCGLMGQVSKLSNRPIRCMPMRTLENRLFAGLLCVKIESDNFPILQPIPVLFRSAESVVISLAYIMYTASKCVLVIYVSWKTKQDAQKTGVHLHKVANVVDENHFYHIVS